ncbi:hypothetical protein HXA35_19705 [Bacillus sp. A301a_S52]|jgi:antitoxin component YwqK of YwqJK toxin-antitoxin module|uniref:hypothetical protein n=1 Tax=Salipaludibacillus agaradhaerens TaxID=76935 RepID=UPI0009972FD1|nr:hypothetical protein [Salipaludibacillus agaradhaerens]MCR6112565.1 hypothetical protein [Bacillus sp. A301a_S52]
MTKVKLIYFLTSLVLIGVIVFFYLTPGQEEVEASYTGEVPGENMTMYYELTKTTAESAEVGDWLIEVYWENTGIDDPITWYRMKAEWPISIAWNQTNSSRTYSSKIYLDDEDPVLRLYGTSTMDLAEIEKELNQSSFDVSFSTADDEFNETFSFSQIEIE